ncbi:MAG TPA: hypothetical protein PJ984_02760 [Candidatus Saccharibacteria bacterium]|jgi:hypothetical protein|nr:hypothetical protein [Candidatus Saccharibacteria bacterium]
MKNTKRVIQKALALVFAVGVLVSPSVVRAATASANTTINATIASVISISTSGTVAIAITPIAGGSQTSASDTVTVSTNNAAGYDLTLANSDATLTLVNGANTIGAHAGTYAAPTALANNTWGYAVGGLGSFDASYTTLTNATTSTTKWSGVPSSASPQNIKSTATVASGDTTTVWYAVKADTTKPNGVYTDTVTYTATTK